MNGPGDLARAFTSGVRIGRGIDLCEIYPVEVTKFLHGTADCPSDKLSLLVEFFGRELVPERYESGDFALWGIVENLGISDFWGVFRLW